MIGQLLAMLVGAAVFALGLFLLATSIGLLTVGCAYAVVLAGGGTLTWAVGL